jgi:hypothetical protein
MTAFDKAWNLVKEEDDTKLQDALDAARKKKRTPLELPEYVRTGSSDDKADDIPMPEEKPFKMRKPRGCDHNFVVTDEDMVGDTLYRTYTCTKCGESMTSSPS